MDSPAATQMWGQVEQDQARWPLRVCHAQPHSLVVSFDEAGGLPESGKRFDRFSVTCRGREVRLGPCVFEAASTDGGHTGALRFIEQVYDFRQLFSRGCVQELGQRVEQLPLVWGRKSPIRSSFRDFTSQLVYDMQVYRALFDDLDRNLEEEPSHARAQVQQLAVRAEYSNFCRFFDERLALLANEVASYSKPEHGQHGFFFRKQLWDLIMCSEFLARTNLKPRGYAGDSEMMRMIYQREFRGSTVFSQFMHRHPIDTAAAQAVRNRRQIVAEAIELAYARRARRASQPLAMRVMSVASGPAWELNDLLRGPEDFHKYEFVLLDQDAHALEEARQTIRHLEERHDARLPVTAVRDSVRTLLRKGLTSLWTGNFDLVYSMGLFDYLTRPVAKVVVGKLYELLAPGGELVIGNFHSGNPTRTYMEYWMDWVLYYRDEGEMLELAADLPGAVTQLDWESSGSQMFLRIRNC